MQEPTFMRKILYFVYVLVFFLSLVPISSNAWSIFSNGIVYQDLKVMGGGPWSHVHVFRIDLQKNTLDLVNARELGKASASAHEFAAASDALLAINAGFFDPHFRPLGLRVAHKSQYNPLKKISWWGVFYIENNRAHIVSPRQFHDNIYPDFALQSGPRLIINNHIPSLKRGIAERTALGITPDGNVIILVTENSALSLQALAHLLKSPPLGCRDAINLDGGSSSQLYAHVGPLVLNAYGLSNVSDAVVVKSRHSKMRNRLHVSLPPRERSNLRILSERIFAELKR